MPTIWLWGGFGWLAALSRSRFGVRRSTFSLRPEPQTQQSWLRSVCRKPGLYYEARRRLARPKVIPSESPMYVRRISHDSPMCLPRVSNRFGLCNTGVHGHVQIWDNPLPHHPKCPSSTPRPSSRLHVGCSCPPFLSRPAESGGLRAFFSPEHTRKA